MPKYLLTGLMSIGVFFYAVQGSAQLVDPTQPSPLGAGTPAANSIPSSESVLELNALMYSAARPVVIINGTVLGLNDWIHHYKVTEIHPQSVTLTPVKGPPLVLELDALSVKKDHIKNSENLENLENSANLTSDRK